MTNGCAAGQSLSGRADLLIQSVTDYAIYMLDPTGVVVSWNAGAERFKGYVADEIIGQHFSRFYTPEDRALGVPEKVLATSRTEGRFEAEGWRVRKDGSRFWANVVVDPIRDETGELVGFAKVTRDLTERMLAQEQLRRSEERFRLLVQSVTDYAIYMLDPDGMVSSWNAGAQRFKGYTEDEIVGQHFSRFYPEEERARGTPAKALATALAEGRFEAEGWRIRKDGSRFWANVVIDPVYGPDGKLVGFAKITRDLTERRETQAALEQAREAFFQSQKMEAIGQLTGGVAHDFNNLLAAIMGSLDLARRRMNEGADARPFLDNALKAAERGATLTQRMLAFARKQELQLEDVDVGECLRDMAELITRTIGQDITIDTRLPLVLPQVRVDRTQLELALLNLVVNARDALPDGGRVVIAARAEPIGLPAKVKFVRLSVRDEGFGMDAETLARAIEPFFTTKGVGKGTGLGLSMVQGMVEQCGGRIEIASAPDAGTTVELWLPVSEQATGSVEEATKCGLARQQGEPLTILAVDDDPIVLLNTAAMLEDMGHRVYEAPSAKAAAKIFAEHRVDLLLTDYAMPEKTGAELVHELRELRPELPVIVVSGYADLPEGTTLEVPRLAKPFRADQLLDAIERIRPGAPEPGRRGPALRRARG
ncbi:MAG: PAS domain S-box protein [Novosphingobium sp.]